MRPWIHSFAGIGSEWYGVNHDPCREDDDSISTIKHRYGCYARNGILQIHPGDWRLGWLHDSSLDTSRFFRYSSSQCTFWCEPVERVCGGTNSAMLCDMAHYVSQMINTQIVAVQHAECLAIVHSHTDSHARCAVFVHDSGDFESLHFSSNHTMLDDHFGTCRAKEFCKAKMCSRGFTTLSVRRRCHRRKRRAVDFHDCDVEREIRGLSSYYSERTRLSNDGHLLDR